MRFLPVSHNIILVELKNLDETLTLLDSLDQKTIAGVEEIIPATRTLMIRFDITRLSSQILINEIVQRDLSKKIILSDKLVEIPVHYNGDDLQEVADYLKITPQEVIQRHIESEYVVAFTGFAPGFAYMTGGDPIFNVPRKKIPRTRIPAGAVGLAGTFSGIYPQASPGGWQIIGVTDEAMFDIERTPPALLQPGFRVKFYNADIKTQKKSINPTKPKEQNTVTFDKTHEIFRVLSAPMPIIFQDLGRIGQASQGVSQSGALDQSSFKTVNKIVGNDENDACLEITLGGAKFEVLNDGVIALSGAPCTIHIDSAKGQHFVQNHNYPISINKGDIIKLSAPQNGVRTYLAVKGGFATEPILGSCARDTLANLGPAPVQSNDILFHNICKKIKPVMLDETQSFTMPNMGETITLDVTMGPRTDWFTKAAIDDFLNQSYEVTAQSNRIGARLLGTNALTRVEDNELPSEATAYGAIQVPASGQPVLFLADHPLTGGYPVIAVIAHYHLDLAGQIPVGSFIRFNAIQPFSELKPQNKTTS